MIILLGAGIDAVVASTTLMLAQAAESDAGNEMGSMLPLAEHCEGICVRVSTIIRGSSKTL